MPKLRAVLHHPATSLVVAIVLISTSLIDVWESVTGITVEMAVGGMEMAIGSHDGLLIYGVVHLFKAIAELVESLERRVRT